MDKIRSDFGSLIMKVGEGGYGSIYASDRNLAVKVFKAKTLGMHSDTLIEIVSLKFLHPSPYIISILGIINFKDFIFFSMELGLGDLTDLFKAGHYDVQDLSRQIVQAVAHCHRFDIIHKDIKPANFIWFSGNHLKLADFGLATMNTCSLKELPEIAYTSYYRAPEVTMKMQYSMTADVWAVGCVLGELVTKSPVFEIPEKKDTIVSVAKSVFRQLGSPLMESADPYEQYRVWRAVFDSEAWKEHHQELENFPPLDFFHPYTDYPELASLLEKILHYDPDNRPDIFEILEELNLPADRVYCGGNLDIRRTLRHNVDIEVARIFKYVRKDKLPEKVAYDTIFIIDSWINHDPTYQKRWQVVSYGLAIKLQGLSDTEHLHDLIYTYFEYSSEYYELEKYILELMNYELHITTAFDLVMAKLKNSPNLNRALEILEQSYETTRFEDPEVLSERCIDEANI